MSEFFISYNKADREFAEWIAWILEEEGHKACIQAWDFRPGSNFVLDMDKATSADKTIAVLSDNYLRSGFTPSEWAAAFAQDPKGTNRKLIPVRVKECKPKGLLGQINYVDLVDVTDAKEARQKIINAIPERLKPSAAPTFPNSSLAKTSQKEVTYPYSNQFLSNDQNSFSKLIDWLARRTDYLESLEPCYHSSIERILKSRQRRDSNLTDLEFDVLELTFSYCCLYRARKALIYSEKYRSFSEEDFIKSMKSLSQTNEKIRSSQVKFSSLVKNIEIAKLIETIE